MARQKSDGEVVGSVRLFIFQRQAAAPILNEVLTPSGVEFASHHDLSLSEQAIAELLRSFASEATFIYVGPLFVGAAWRRHGVGAILGLAANAVFRLHDCRLGLTMATTRDHAADLFLKLGAHRLQVNGQVLPPFWCARHGELLEMLGLDPLRADPQLEETIELLREQFCSRLESIESSLPIWTRSAPWRGAASHQLV